MIPPQTLYRIGYGRDPLAWPAPRWTGDNRFDDPLTPPRFRVLYAAEERRACFAEVLATQRPDLRQVAAEQAITGTDEPLEPSVIPASWRRERTVGWFEVGANQRWLDLRDPHVWHSLRNPFAAVLIALGIPDLDVSAITRADAAGRLLTQLIATWAYMNDYHGILYASRLDARATCWAIFGGSTIMPIGEPQPILANDPDLLAVARDFGLAIAPD